MTPRSELIFDHEIFMADQAQAPGMIAEMQVGRSVRGHVMPHGLVCWYGDCEWLGEQCAVILIEWAVPNLVSDKQRLILAGERVLFTWEK